MSLQKAQLQSVSIFFIEFVHPGVPPLEVLQASTSLLRVTF